MKTKVNQKHLFNSEGDRVTTYAKIPITKEIRITRLYAWLYENIDRNYQRELDYGELQEHDKFSDSTDIVLADWNNLPDSLPKYIESLGICTGWSDEYSTCTECAKCIQTNPDSYGWEPNYIITDSECLCRECIESSIDIITDNEFSDSHFINNDNIALPSWCIELVEKEGFKRYNDQDESFENGWYSGQTDTPQKVLDSINNIDINDYERLWIIDGKGQFDINFSLYLKFIEKD